MRKILIIIVFLNISADAEQNLAKRRNKRALWNFADIIECMTGRSAYYDYNGYGCWCGKGGRGQPVDGIDRCCHDHDQCYGRVIDRCYWFTPYFDGYSFTCVNGEITCNEQNGSCDYRSCMCDREMGYCIREHSYNENFSPDNMDDELCGGNQVNVESSEEQCLEFGDIREISRTVGAPSQITRLYGLSVTGEVGSRIMADMDAPHLEQYRSCFDVVGQMYGIQPSLLAAIVSRVSRAGQFLNNDGSNNVFPQLFGSIGCITADDFDCSSADQTTDCSVVQHTIERQFIRPYIELGRRQPRLSRKQKLQATLRQYLGSSSNYATKQFEHDVIARAKALLSKHQWQCIGPRSSNNQDGPIQGGILPEVVVIPPPRNETCVYLATYGICDFFHRCMETKVPCFDKGYAIKRGENFCLRYQDHYNDFNSTGQIWIDNIWSCITSTIYPLLKRPNIKCGTLSSMAESIEFSCMKKHGFCNMIEDNIDAMKEVYDEGRLYISQSFTAAQQEIAIWSQIYKNYVSCMNGCDVVENGVSCPSFFKSMWVRFRGSIIFRELGRRKRRSVEGCGEQATSGDCDFWQCLESELQCSSGPSGSIAKDFQSAFCFEINMLVNDQVRNMLQLTQRCLMNRVIDLLTEENDHSCVDVEFCIISNTSSCLVESGICDASTADEWALERVTNVKGFPAVLPDDYRKVSSSGKVVKLTATYYEWLKFFKQQIGDAKRLCSYRGLGRATSPDLYEMRYNRFAGTEVRYRTDRSEL